MRIKIHRIRKARRGVAQAIGVFLLLLIVFAVLYIPLNFAVQAYEGIQVQLWSNNVFDPDVLTFVEDFWHWLPAMVFLFAIEYVYLRAQRQGPE